MELKSMDPQLSNVVSHAFFRVLDAKIRHTWWKCFLPIFRSTLWEWMNAIFTLYWFLKWHCLLPKGQQVKPIISKAHSKKEFWFFHQIFFLAFNSKDMTMLWVLNLFSRSSPTKLRKRIFDKMSQKIFFDTWSGLASPKL